MLAKVRVAVKAKSEPGDLHFASGETAVTGIYFVRLVADGVVDTRKIVLLK